MNEYTTVDEIQAEIAACKILLRDTDYMAQKYAEGWLTEEGYADTKQRRQGWRDKINMLEERRAAIEAEAPGAEG